MISLQPFAISDNFVPAIAPFADDQAALDPALLPVRWFICQRSNLVVTQAGVAFPAATTLAEMGIAVLRTQFLGYLKGQPCMAAEWDAGLALPERFTLMGLRDLHGQVSEDLFAIASRAVQIVDWDRTHQYCGHCATPMTQLPTERSKRCPTCDLRQYPRLSPAVIMLVFKGEQLLLARSPRFPDGLYSVLAGFVEPGESLEETVAREVREEVGIEIENIRYFGSQPWPFPNSLMVGFTAEYASGTITPAPAEIEDAAWFDKGGLPSVPGELSIARKLIDWFVSQ